MEADRIEGALATLDPESRALVELSLIRDVADEDIADILGTDVGEVRIRRADALVLLAVDLGAASGEEVGALMHDMRELPDVRWRDEGEAHHQPLPAWDPEPEPEPEPEAESEPEAEPATPAPTPVEPGAKRRRRLGPAVLAGAVVAAIVALVLALSGGDDDDGGGADRAADPGAPAAASDGRGKLTPLAGGAGSGNVKLTGDKLELSVSGLPDHGDGGYVVWLYNSLAEARPLSRPNRSSAFELMTALPQAAGRYRFIDVSLEPADSNRNHSGQSVLRVPLSELR